MTAGKRWLRQVLVAVFIAAGAFALASPALADPASDAAAVLATNMFYVSPGAAAFGVTAPEPVGSSAQSVKLAVFAEDEGSAGQLARQIQNQLSSTISDPLTVGVAMVSSAGITSFSAVSDSKSYCKGGPDIAARDALAALNEQSVDLKALVSGFEDRLAQLPPDKGESSCASARPHRADSDLGAWLWLIAAAVIGVIAIGGFTWYVHRTVRARGVEPNRENIPEWITDEDADDSDDEPDE